MLQPLVRRTWAPRGQTPIQYSWDRHDRLSVISAITVSPLQQRFGLCFRIHDHNITFQEVMAFLTMLHRRQRRKFIVVLDRLNAHRKAVRLLQEAQEIQNVVLYPWRLIPLLYVVVAVLAFNFLGDGIRDAADPYR